MGAIFGRSLFLWWMTTHTSHWFGSPPCVFEGRCFHCRHVEFPSACVVDHLVEGYRDYFLPVDLIRCVWCGNHARIQSRCYFLGWMQLDRSSIYYLAYGVFILREELHTFGNHVYNQILLPAEHYKNRFEERMPPSCSIPTTSACLCN